MQEKLYNTIITLFLEIQLNPLGLYSPPLAA